MRIRTILAATALAGAATLTLAGSAFAGDRDCLDFTSHADAQAAFDAVPGDPEGLDADGDGKACEDQFVDDLVGDSGDSGDSGSGSGDSSDGWDDDGSSADGGADDGGADDGDAPVGGVATGGGGTAAGPGAAAPLAAASASVLLIGVLAAAVRRSGRPHGWR
jgi:hypothetical protein